MTLLSIPSESRPTARYTATAPFYLGAVFIFLISFPGLLELPGGISVALAVMFFSLPFWFRAASLRDGSVFDPAALAGLAIILPCNIFLIAWAFLSVVGAETPFLAGRSIASLAGALAVYFLVLGTITSARMDAYLRVACIALAFTCLVSFIALFEPKLHEMIFRGSDRALAFFKNPNQFGIAISTLMPVTIAYIVIERERRFFWVMCFALFILGLVLSGSKTNLLLSAATTGIMILATSYILNTGPRRVGMIVLSFGLYLFFILIGVFLLNILNPRAVRILTKFFSSDGEVQSLQQGRARLWKISIDQMMANPIFGQGASQPLDVFDDGGKLVTHSHNIFLDFARTLGIPGLFVFLIIFTTALVLLFGAMRVALASGNDMPHSRVLTMGLSVGSVAYLAANTASDSMGPSTSPFFWVVFFLCLASRRRLFSRTPTFPTDNRQGQPQRVDKTNLSR